LGGLKAARGGCYATSIVLFHSYLKNLQFILAMALFFNLSALPSFNFPKDKAKIFDTLKISLKNKKPPYNSGVSSHSMEKT